MTYHGSCHCGAVKYRFETPEPIAAGVACNCSRCHRLGTVLVFIPVSDFHLESGEESLTEYRFNTKKIAHLFCKVCGVQSFSRAVGPDGAETAAVNLRCVDEVDTDTLVTTKFNGKDF